MPKVKACTSKKLDSFVKEFGSDVFSTDGSILFCKACEKSVNFEKKYFISQHLETSKHKTAKDKKDGKTPTLIPTCFQLSSRKSEFAMDLCRSFVDAGIPLWKLENKSIRAFLQKYTNQSVPCESTLRKTYLDDCYTEVLKTIQNEIGTKNIWLSIDETTDVTGRYVANVIVGVMDPFEKHKIFLLTSEQLQKTNSTTIAQLFTNALALLWPNGIEHERVLLFLTDAATYMKKAGNALKVLFPNMIHLTCLAHALHRIAEEVRGLYPEVDSLVSSVKKVFVKAPSRVQVFKEIAPDIQLPPKPILTRWGTWISAVSYYCTNFEEVTRVLTSFSDEEAISIRKSKSLLSSSKIKNELTFISTYFGKLPGAIEHMEKRNMSLSESLKIFDNTIEELMSVPGPAGDRIRKKCENVISANTDFECIKDIAKVLSGDTTVELTISPTMASCFRYAPITSVEVERSFSLFKTILTDRRQNFTFEHLKKHLVVMCNNNQSSE